MLRLLRAGFWRDMSALILITVVLGSVLASGVSWAVDRYFAKTVSGIVGEYGEYDAIVHVREDMREAAAQSLRRLAEKQLGGARVKAGLTVAGKANFFIAIPSPHKSRRQFETLDGILSTLPGYAGLTFITEPSVAMRNVHPALRESLSRSLATVQGVRFVFRDGTNLVAVLDTPSRTDAVYRAAKKISSDERILEVRFPFQYRLDNPEQAAREVEGALQRMWGKNAVRDITVAGREDEMGSFITALRDMKRFLLGYATRVEIDLAPGSHVVNGDTLELSDGVSSVTVRLTGIHGNRAVGYAEKGDAAPLLDAPVKAKSADGVTVGQAVLINERMQLVEAIDASLVLLEQLSGLAHDAGGAVGQAEQTLQTFEAALVQLDTVQEQVRQINEELTTKGEADPGQVLLSVILSGLVKKVQPQSAAADLKKVDVPGMQASLRDMADRLEAMSRIDVNAVSREVRKVRENLPDLTDQEIGDSLRLIDRYLEGQVVPGDQIQLLLQPGVDARQCDALVKSVLGRQDISLFTSPGAVVTPDARATLFSVLGQVRRTIAGIAVIVLALLALMLDHATLFSTLQRMRKRPKVTEHRPLARWMGADDAWAMMTGAALFTGMYLGSGAGIPGVTPAYVLLIGMIMGLLIKRLAVRISPVDANEVEAGIALGLSPAQVMREIVIPASRPGLLLLLNRPRQMFQ